MVRERAKFNFDEEEATDDGEIRTGVDIEEIVGVKTSPEITNQQREIIIEEAKKAGFISREPKKRRKVSPYTAQFGGKCRVGMKELFQDIGAQLGKYDTQTLELAIIALIEKENMEDLEKQFYDLVGNADQIVNH